MEQYRSVYSPEKGKEIAKMTNKLSELMKREIAANSPSPKGEYAGSWTYKRVMAGNNYDFESVVYNKQKYMLTHLLEKPHKTGLYGYYTGKPHIAPAEEKYTAMYVEKIREIVSR